MNTLNLLQMLYRYRAWADDERFVRAGRSIDR